MTTPITFNPTVTTAGQAAAVSAANNGLSISITAISFGTGNYVPSVGQTALTNQVKSITIGGGGLVNPNQIRMSAIWSDNTSNCAIYEVGFWAGSTLFAVWSAGGGSASPLGYKTPGVNFVLFNDLYFSQLPPGSVTVTVDGSQSAMLAALSAHEVASNAHPQYQLISDFVDAQSAIWCGLAGGTANNLILTLPVSQTAVTQYNAGQRYVFKASAANTAGVTAQVIVPGANGSTPTTLAAQAVTKAGTTALNPGDIAASALYELIYDGISGAQFQISGGASGAASRTVYEYTVTAAQALTNQTAILSFAASYIVGMQDVEMQGRVLSSSDFTASDGATVQFPIGTFKGGESVRVVSWSAFNVANAAQFRTFAEFTLTAGQSTITTPYTPGMFDLIINGSTYTSQDCSGTNGTTITITDPTKINAGDVARVVCYKPYAVANALPLSGGTMTGPIAMAGGDTAVTQATGDYSNAPATDKFVGNEIAYAQLMPATTPVMASGAITLGLNPCTLGFRSATIGAGGSSQVNISAALSLVGPVGATFGSASGALAEFAVIAINNAGAAQLGIVNTAGGIDLSEQGLISTAAISASSTANNVVYSTTAVTNCPYRVVQRFQATQATAGTWGTAPSTVINFGGAVPVPRNSMVQLNTANGYGSTNTVIRRFTTVLVNQGTDITYADSSTLGASFTINTAGVYAISYNDQFITTGGNFIGLSVNSNQLTTSIASMNVANILAAGFSSTASAPGTAVFTGYLPAGAVVRAHTAGAASGTNTTLCQFTIARVA